MIQKKLMHRHSPSTQAPTTKPHPRTTSNNKNNYPKTCLTHAALHGPPSPPPPPPSPNLQSCCLLPPRPSSNFAQFGEGGGGGARRRRQTPRPLHEPGTPQGESNRHQAARGNRTADGQEARREQEAPKAQARPSKTRDMHALLNAEIS